MTTFRTLRPRDDWADLGSRVDQWLDRRLGIGGRTEDEARAKFDLVGRDVPVADLIDQVQRERERLLRDGTTRPELWVSTIGQLTLLEALEGLSPLAFDAWRALTEGGADMLDTARAVRDATTSSEFS
ncbi:hypothetical protein SAMN04488570_2872 [Nocardioides scoriae]|uniref:Uncharacterized protein n=1 Tax=Nocardioides scoriae TaxID=642780 RepID=A0A1H1VLC7_9ACTN|nr:hypothetical protein [Nocardioides scoriae]SDS85697.1 hypothetical protein SAMN04488570_2872 [Nocardioides scoriae]